MKTLKPSTIAIDGPVASGKSTLGELLAERLGYLYFDTGVMYRAVAHAALDQGIDPEDDAPVARLANTLHVDVVAPTVGNGRQYTVFADGVDVTWAIRRPEVDVAVSPVSANPGVRAALTPQQRRIAERGHIVMAGRDIGTVVLPDADLKIYLDATPEERAFRRHRELRARGLEESYDGVLSSVRRRDAYDSGRQTAPLRAADDAVIINSSGMTVEQVLEQAMALVQRRAAAGGGEGLIPQASGGSGERAQRGKWRPVLEPVLRFLLWLFVRVEFEGMERVPTKGPLMLIYNHIHMIDPLVLVAWVPRYAVAIGKVEIFSWPVVGPLVRHYPTIPIRRGELDMAAVRQSLAVLKAAHALIIAPEGTRSVTGVLQLAKRGMILLAQETDALIMPVSVTGTPEFYQSLRRLRRVSVRYRFGRPFRFAWPQGRLARGTMQQMADEAMYELARLLPAEMRGAYANLDEATTEWLRFTEE
ncbi:MAG TPA: (d)CMP kinase, partial [Anaerolineae bacterium]|nr:(d)CMP kinase [Anaerolineae bacterium]